MNLYEYVGSMPTYYVDPMGTDWIYLAPDGTEFLIREEGIPHIRRPRNPVAAADLEAIAKAAREIGQTFEGPWSANPRVSDDGIGAWASDWARENAGDDRDLRNALRHAAWAAELQRVYGDWPTWWILEGHELGSRQTKDSYADRFNNSVGRGIGRRACSRENVESQVLKAAESGELITDLDDPIIPDDLLDERPDGTESISQDSEPVLLKRAREGNPVRRGRRLMSDGGANYETWGPEHP